MLEKNLHGTNLVEKSSTYIYINRKGEAFVWYINGGIEKDYIKKFSTGGENVFRIKYEVGRSPTKNIQIK